MGGGEREGERERDVFLSSFEGLRVEREAERKGLRETEKKGRERCAELRSCFFIWG